MGKRRASQRDDGSWDLDGRGVDPTRTVLDCLGSIKEVPSSTTLPSPASSSSRRRNHDSSHSSTQIAARFRPAVHPSHPPASSQTRALGISSTPSLSFHDNSASHHTPSASTLPTSYESFWASLASPANAIPLGSSHFTGIRDGAIAMPAVTGGGAPSDVERIRASIRQPMAQDDTTMSRSWTEPLPILKTMSPPPSTPPRAEVSPNGTGLNGILAATEFPSPVTSKAPFLTHASLSPSTAVRQRTLSPQFYRSFSQSTSLPDRYNNGTTSQEEARDRERLSQVSRGSTRGVLSRMTGSQLLSDPMEYASEDRSSGSGIRDASQETSRSAGSTQ